MRGLEFPQHSSNYTAKKRVVENARKQPFDRWNGSGKLLETDALVQRARARRGNREQRREIVPSDCFLNKQIRCHDSDRSRFFLNRISLTVFLFRGTRHRAAWPRQISPGNALFTRYRTRIRGPGIPRARANCATDEQTGEERGYYAPNVSPVCVHRFFVVGYR